MKQLREFIATKLSQGEPDLVQARIDKELADKFRTLCHEEGQTVSEMLRILVEFFVTTQYEEKKAQGEETMTKQGFLYVLGLSALTVVVVYALASVSFINQMFSSFFGG